MTQSAARELAIELAERMMLAQPVTVVRFFSGAGLVAGGVQFGFVITGSLYLRVDDQTRAAYIAAGAAPFSYRGRSKPVTVASYFEAPSDVIDDRERLTQWAADALRAARAAKKKKTKRAR
jgi:DNA transformation protein and related proteins